MNAVTAIKENQASLTVVPKKLVKRASESNTPDVLTDMYEEDVNIAVWQRTLPESLTAAANEILSSGMRLKVEEVVTAKSVRAKLIDACGDSNAVLTLIDDIELLVDMYSCLFDLKAVGLRFTTLDKAMCPRFHFDRIPCRLITTYHGVATEWLPHEVVDRSKLGAGNQGKSDEESGLFKSTSDIRQLSQGDVALLKGEYWHNNEGAGLVHRSPAVPKNSTLENRLLLTLDFFND